VAARLGRPLGGPPWRGLLRPATGLNGSARVTVGRLGDPNPPPPREPPPPLGPSGCGRRHFGPCAAAAVTGERRRRWPAPVGRRRLAMGAPPPFLTVDAALLPSAAAVASCGAAAAYPLRLRRRGRCVLPPVGASVACTTLGAAAPPLLCGVGGRVCW
jgi:hypothetical protein